MSKTTFAAVAVAGAGLWLLTRDDADAAASGTTDAQDTSTDGRFETELENQTVQTHGQNTGDAADHSITTTSTVTDTETGETTTRSGVIGFDDEERDLDSDGFDTVAF